jgi:hypothetical protein
VKETPKETLIAKIYRVQNDRIKRLEEHMAELEARVDEINAWEFACKQSSGG